MKTYELNGKLYRFPEDKVPAGAKLHRKAPEPKQEPAKATETPEEVKPKAKKAPANKARKAGADK